MPETADNESQSTNYEIQLQEGLRAYALPEFGQQNSTVGWKDVVPPTPEGAQAKLNQVLASIEKQGGQLMGIIDIGVAIPSEPGVMRGESSSVPKPFLIVKK